MENIPNKMHITAPETISTCTMITFPHSQHPLLNIHVLSIAKHVGQVILQQQTDIYERCLHDGSLYALYAYTPYSTTYSPFCHILPYIYIYIYIN